MREEQETRLAPPCAHDGCGQLPAAHIGWALGHLYTEPEGVHTPVEPAAPVDWEAEGKRAIAAIEEAYARWLDMPQLRLRIGRQEAYANILALQVASAHPGVSPALREAWVIMGRQLAELVADTPDIQALVEAGWHRENDVLVQEQADPETEATTYDVITEAERQPTEAGATAYHEMINLVTRDSGGIPPNLPPDSVERDE